MDTKFIIYNYESQTHIKSSRFKIGKYYCRFRYHRFSFQQKMTICVLFPKAELFVINEEKSLKIEEHLWYDKLSSWYPKPTKYFVLPRAH